MILNYKGKGQTAVPVARCQPMAQSTIENLHTAFQVVSPILIIHKSVYKYSLNIKRELGCKGVEGGGENIHCTVTEYVYN